jgi:V-type H+-transporting ATPase 16kDa proteolipid subunit
MVSPNLFTALGAAAAVFFSSLGGAIGSVPAGMLAVRSHWATNGIKAFFPIIIAGVLAMYGLIVAAILSYKLAPTAESTGELDGHRNLAAGLSVGLACLASGYGMSRFLFSSMAEGITASCVASSDSTTTQPLLPSGSRGSNVSHSVSWSLVMVMVYLEAIGLYGFVVALLLV